MIKPKIISDLEMQELAKGISRAEADHKIAQAQNDYTIRQIAEGMRRIKADRGVYLTNWELVWLKLQQALQSQLEEEV